MVSAGVPPPVVQSVAEAVAVQVAASKARSSVTVTAPRAPVMVVPGAPAPRFAETGAVIDRAPVVTAKVTVVSGSLPDGVFDDQYESAAGRSATADAAPGDRAIPMTTAAVRIRNTGVNIGPPINPGVDSTVGPPTLGNRHSTLCN